MKINEQTSTTDALKKRTLLSYRNRARRFHSDKNPIYLNRNHKTYGPYCEIDIKRFLSHKNVLPKDKIWFPALDNWISVGDYVDDFYIPSDIEENNSDVYYLLRNGESWGPYEAGRIVDFMELKIVLNKHDRAFSVKEKRWELVDNFREIMMIDFNRIQNLQIVQNPGLACQDLPKSMDWYFIDSDFQDITPSSAINLSQARSLNHSATGNSLLAINTELGKYYTQDDWNAHGTEPLMRLLHVFDRQILKELLPEKDVSKAKKLTTEEDWDKELCQQKKNNRFPAVWYSRKFNPVLNTSLTLIAKEMENFFTQNEVEKYKIEPTWVLRKAYQRQLIKEHLLKTEPSKFNKNLSEEEWERGIYRLRN